MNKPLAESEFATPKVTTGPIAGSRKVYSAPEAAPDLRVPYREIALSEGAGEEPVRVYDPSGVYTDSDAAIEVEKGLKRGRMEWVKERGGVEAYDGRAIKPVDNGNVSGKHLARSFPNTPKPMRAVDSSPPPLRGRSDRQRVRPEVAGPMTSSAIREGGQSGIPAQAITPLPNPPPSSLHSGARERGPGGGREDFPPLSCACPARLLLLLQQFMNAPRRGGKDNLSRTERIGNGIGDAGWCTHAIAFG
jgi:hypothetical protein